MDNFLEEAVRRKNPLLGSVLYVLLWVFTVAGALVAGMYLTLAFQMGAGMWMNALMFLLFGLGAYLCFRYKDRLRTEYECSITNGLVEISAVYNNRRRRDIITFKMKDVQGLTRGDDTALAERVSHEEGVKFVKIALNPDAPAYLVYLVRGAEKFLIRMEVSREFAHVMKIYAPNTADIRLDEPEAEA
ncbi:MAG: hypothetical protein PHD32_10315 [Eubacteriales bacterium]|nr:hypothetical protein [Eubacteriales bacterium]